ncbi:MAG: hypothetical protein WBO17_06555 [Sphingorhabdus sp.]
MTDYSMAPPPARSGVKFKHILILLLIAFAGGGTATWWMAREYGYLSKPTAAPVVPISSAPAAPANVAPVLPPSDTVANIENRLTQINADAAAASGNASRAEGLLVAFAARRAIDSGAPLGYLADQLRVRFGSSQPQAVATIFAASQNPVTLDTLQLELNELEPVLLTGSRETGIWQTVSREFSELFVLRKDGAPSPAPSRRLERAHVLVESGNVAGAITEISALPGAASAQSWLIKARRYSQARNALDTLERSAIVAPPPAPIVTSPSLEDIVPTPTEPENAQAPTE